LTRFGDRLERLVVETSGLADPAPVLQTFLAYPDVRERVELESVVAVVDACHALVQLDDEIAREQVVFADRIVINKTDAVSPAALDKLIETILSLNPTAIVDFARHSRVAVDSLLGTRSFSIDNLLAVEPGLLTESGMNTTRRSPPALSSCRASWTPRASTAGPTNSCSRKARRS
jgi:G3E family GTPase